MIFQLNHPIAGKQINTLYIVDVGSILKFKDCLLLLRENLQLLTVNNNDVKLHVIRFGCPFEVWPIHSFIRALELDCYTAGSLDVTKLHTIDLIWMKKQHQIFAKTKDIKG